MRMHGDLALANGSEIWLTEDHNPPASQHAIDVDRLGQIASLGGRQKWP